MEDGRGRFIAADAIVRCGSDSDAAQVDARGADDVAAAAEAIVGDGLMRRRVMRHRGLERVRHSDLEVDGRIVLVADGWIGKVSHAEQQDQQRSRLEEAVTASARL